MAATVRRRVLTAAAMTGAAAALVVTTAVVVKSAESGAAPGPPAAPAGPAVVAVESSCGLAGTPGPDAAGATAANWENVNGWPLPTSTTDGPGRKTRGAWSCYTRTPAGAVLAGYVIGMRVSGVTDDWEATVRQGTLPGPGRDELLTATPNLVSVTTPRGFHVVAYSADAATIRYRLELNGQDYACLTDVAWSEGDWRLVLSDDGSTASGCVQGIPDEFTPWGP